MMTIVFLSLAVIIAIVVILVSAKHIKKGFEARSEVKEQQRNENVSQEDEEILDKLKDKNLSPEDLKKIYEDLQKKK
jgi:predicted Holliday junction resolvase-like endonuclease